MRYREKPSTPASVLVCSCGAASLHPQTPAPPLPAATSPPPLSCAAASLPPQGPAPPPPRPRRLPRRRRLPAPARSRAAASPTPQAPAPPPPQGPAPLPPRPRRLPRHPLRWTLRRLPKRALAVLLGLDPADAAAAAASPPPAASLPAPHGKAAAKSHWAPIGWRRIAELAEMVEGDAEVMQTAVVGSLDLGGSSNLSIIHFENNQLTGSVPSYLGSLPKLSELDIKGANILVDPSGRVKLAEFGMAKHSRKIRKTITSITRKV